MDNPFNQLNDMCEQLDIIGKGLDEVIEKQKDIVIAVQEIIDEAMDSRSIFDD